MRRSILVLLIALPTLLAPAASAKDPTPPAGAWTLQVTWARYEGPPIPIRAALIKGIDMRRVVFSPACTQTTCVTYANMKTARGRAVRFVLKSTRGGPYTGSVKYATGLRCGGRALRATFTLAATMFSPQQPTDRLTGTTSAVAVNPGGCSLFRGYARGLRRTKFVGVAANG